MDEIKDINYPGLGGMNSDDDDVSMPENDYRYAYNIVNTEDGNERIVVNCRGNEAKTNSLPSGNNKIIAFKEDVENKAGIFFIYNESGNHSIHRYNSDSEDFTEILDGEQASGYVGSKDTVGKVLNFDVDDTLDVDIVGSGTATRDGEGQLLLWCGGSNPPRKINITKAINFTAGAGTPTYNAISDIEINQIKQPPLKSPELTFYSNTDREINNLRSVVYQVAVQFIYDDNEVSVMSPASKVLIPQDEEFCNGFGTGDISKNNYIKVVFSPVTYDTVVGANILIREGDVGSGALVDWMLYDSIEIVNGAPYTYYIYGDKIPTALSQTDLQRNYDAIGQEVRRQALINNSRLVHGDITEGYANVDLNVELSVAKQQVTDIRDAYELYFRRTVDTQAVDIKWASPSTVKAVTGAAHGYANGDIITISGTDDYNGDHQITVTDPNEFYFDFLYVEDQSGTAQPKELVMEFPFSVEEYITLTILVGAATYYRYILTNTYGKTRLQISNFFVDKITAEGSGDFSASTHNDYIRVSKDGGSDIVVTFHVFKMVDKYKTHYNGATYYYGLVYYDEHGNRCGYANADDDSQVYIPTHGEQTGFGYNDFLNGVRWQIKHLPPEFAYTYQWVCARSSVLWMQPYIVNYADITEDTETEYFKIAISDAVVRTNSYVQNSQLPAYVFADGDRLRVVGGYKLGASLETPATMNVINLFSGTIDVAIHRQDDSGDIYIPVTTSNSEFFNLFEATGPGAPTVLDYFLIEIYHPSEYDEEDRYYYEIGECFDIINPGTANRCHGAGNAAMGFTAQEQSYLDPVSTPAIGIIEGDCYLIPFLWDKVTDSEIPIVLPVVSESMSMVYDSNKSDEGRFHVINVSAIRKRYEKIRWGGKYVDDSNLNYLSKFDFNDEKPLDSRYGRIFKMKQRGGVFRVYQENKATSFNLDSTTSTDVEGNVIVSYADQIVSNGIQSVESYGLKHSKSFVAKGSYFYYFDFNNFSVIRDAVNGSVPVSKYKMRRFFKEKVQKIIEIGESDFDIIGAFDETNDMYFITFKQKVPNNIYVISDYSDTVLGTVLASMQTDHDLVTGERIRIWGSANYTGVYEITVVDSNTFYFYADFVSSQSPYWDRSETVGFHEPSNRWVSFYNFAPDLYGKIQNKFISFPDRYTYLNGGDLFIHDSLDVNRCTFYGDKYKVVIKMVFNKNHQAVKVYNSMEQNSNQVWDIGMNNSIKIRTSDKYPNGMQSRLKSALFDNIEGMYYANFLKDMLTDGSTPELYHLFNGRDLRGSTIELNMTSSDNDQVRLVSVTVNSQTSK